MYRCMGCMEEYDEEYELCPHCGYVRGTQANEIYHLQPESILKGRYIIGKVVGYGGFGVTYIAWDNLLEKKVAVKEYFPSEFATRMPGHTEVTIFSGDREEQFASGKDKFEDEAKRLVRFNETPGIVTVFDTFVENNTAYIVMEFLEGRSLKQYIDEKGKLSVDETLEIIIPVLEALCFVHKEGIIHRDIAPDNIFLCDDGSVKLIDFGASRFATTKHSKSLSVILKPGYSPVEQYRSKGDQGPWTDVYSVAATFYKAITGVTPMDSMERDVKDGLKEPSKLGVKINKSTENSLMNALNIRIEGRTQTAEAFLEDLRAEEVKRIKIKNKKMDIGKWPLWTKISASVASVAIIGFLVLLATGVISFNITGLKKNVLPEGTTRIPNVINLSVDEAQIKCDESSLILQVVDKDYSDVIPEGQVLRQSAMGGIVQDIAERDLEGNLILDDNGDWIKHNNTLGVIVSAGIKQEEVPDLYGYAEEQAEAILENMDMDYIASEVSHVIAPGGIASQNIERESIAESGTTIQLTKSTGMAYNQSEETTVPDITGEDEYKAATMLGDAGLYLSKVEMKYDITVPKYSIISQDIAAGTTLNKDSVVSVIVSLGGTVVIPDVQYKDEEEATNTLETSGLKVVIEYEDSDTVARGKVIRQSLEAGSSVDAGTEIIIYISNGRDDAEVIRAEDVMITNEIQQQYEEVEEEQPDNKIIAFNNPFKNDSTTETTTESTTSVSSVTNTSEAANATTSTIVENTTEATTETNKKPKVVIPSVIGLTEEEANAAIIGAGLKVSSSYKHDKKTEDHIVMTQSLPAGMEATPGTTILLVVCNNEMKTQYATRTVTEETTESSTNDLNGVDDWKLENTTWVWGDYGAWSGWSDSAASGSDSRDVQSRTLYQYRDYESTSVTNDSSSYSMDGWNYLRTNKNEGALENKSTTTKGYSVPVSGTSTLEIQNLNNSITNYIYYHWCNYYDNTWNVDSIYYGSGPKDGYCHHYTSGRSALPSSSTKYDDKGNNKNGECYYNTCSKCGYNIWWLDTGNSTYTWTWQQRTVSYTHYFERWTGWTDWSESAVSSSGTRQVNTKNQYRYRDRSQIYTYHYRRTVYGEFSDWSDTAPTNTEGIEVTTREVYVYD